MTASLRNRSGMTLIEMLLALAVFMLVAASALRFVIGESRGYRKASDELASGTALRFGADLLSQELRTAGANVSEGQPEAVYASGDVFAYNADYASNLPDDIAAAYVDVDAPDEEVAALSAARATAILGSSPAFSYPARDYLTAGTPSNAETITFAFLPDTSSARSDDFMLLRKVNDQPARLVLRGVLRSGGAPFFSYLRIRKSGASLVLDSVPAAWLPLRHTAAVHGGPADSGSSRRTDSLRAARVSYAVSNGRSGADERIRASGTVIPLPNLGLTKLKSCGDEPIMGQPLAAIPGGAAGVPAVELAWPAAVDEAGGEHDVMRYVLWRRRQADPDWGTPMLSLPSGNTTYGYTDLAVASGETYVYAVASQDCTPALSSRSISAAVTIP